MGSYLWRRKCQRANDWTNDVNELVGGGGGGVAVGGGGGVVEGGGEALKAEAVLSTAGAAVSCRGPSP
ncbi:MAG: hypothetical protein U0361_05610 [Nitrospiraceae bacterium]